MQHYISGDHEFVALMITGTVHKQQDELPGVFFRPRCPEKSGSILYRAPA